MFLTLTIDQIGPARYRAAVTHAGVQVADGETLHPSVADAIQRTAQGVPAGFAHFIEPRFAGVTCGTLLVRDACDPRCAEDAARKIMGLVADMQMLGEA
jgi:hypothetical protein